MIAHHGWKACWGQRSDGSMGPYQMKKNKIKSWRVRLKMETRWRQQNDERTQLMGPTMILITWEAPPLHHPCEKPCFWSSRLLCFFYCTSWNSSLENFENFINGGIPECSRLYLSIRKVHQKAKWLEFLNPQKSFETIQVAMSKKLNIINFCQKF